MRNGWVRGIKVKSKEIEIKIEINEVNCVLNK